MKYLRYVLFVFICCFSFNFAQTTNETYYNNLYYTCKVWGFLKYFHTSVADGKLNWDSVLVTNLPKLKNTDTDYNSFLSIFFNAAGQMQTPSTPLPNVPKDLSYNLNTDWMKDDIFNSTSKSTLQDIFIKFRPRDNYYIQDVDLVGNPLLNNDKQYYSMASTTLETRLLALFRYWNIINYFYPYKNILDKNWDDVLKEMIPIIANCTDEISYNSAIMRLTANINDAHAVTYGTVIAYKILGQNYLPIKLKYIKGSTVVLGAPLGFPQVKPGDIIKKINGIPVENLRNNLRPITNGSNEASLERNINRNLVTFTDNKIVQLEIENEKGVSTVSSNLINQIDYNYLDNNAYPANLPEWSIINKNGKNFGLVNMGKLTVSNIPIMFNALWNTDALILDCRNYPNGTGWYMINYLFPSPIMIAKFTIPDITFPGTFYWASDVQGYGDFSKTYNKRIYILFNEDTQSQAEFTIMAFEQHPMAVKIGSQTAGADGNTSKLYLPGGIFTYFTGLGTFYSNFQQTQRIGIVPNIEVTPTIQGIRDGRDEVMEAAFNHYFGVNDIEQKKEIPQNYSLNQNYPNPFNPTTTIKFSIPSSQYVTLKVYDLLGKNVATLVNSVKQPGSYEINFNGEKLTSGVYFYQLKAGSFVSTKKFLLMK